MSKTIQLRTPENNIEINPEKSLVPIVIVGDRVLIEPFEPEKSLSEKVDLHRPVSMKEPFKKGKLVSIGGGEYGTSIPASLKVGMVVHYWHQQALDMEVDKKTYHLVRASDVFMYL